MPYTLCILGCGTMGVAVISGVLDRVKTSRPDEDLPLSDPSQPFSTTAKASHDASHDVNASSTSIPNRYIACVGRDESLEKLGNIWTSLGFQQDQQHQHTFTRNSHENQVCDGITIEIQNRVGQNVKSVRESDVILLACKPYMANTILTEPGMSNGLKGKLVVSVLAGVTTVQLQQWTPKTTCVVRAMPNTPCKIRQGMTILSSFSQTPSDSTDYKAIVISLFAPSGRIRFLDEKYFDACTALSGSGPAFALVILEAMVDGGVMMGLPRHEATELAAQTMQGAARMVLETGLHPAALKDTVTTPGGCTIAGLLTLEDGRVRSTMARCIQAAAQHAAGLGGAPKYAPTEPPHQT